jgi:hypothetical protein
MAKRKKSSARKVTKKRAKPVKKRGEKKPEYMIQLKDPATLRKELLEILREIIIFMQSYEKFKQIQEQKINTFIKLKEDVKELTNLIDKKIRGHFPKGKLNSLIPQQNKVVDVQEEVEPPTQAPVIEEIHQKAPVNGDLDELEQQLKDIENQLQSLN